MTAPQAISPAVDRFLQSSHPLLRSLMLARWLYVGLFVVVHAVLALTSNGAEPADLPCLLLVSAPLLLLLRRRDRDLGLPAVAAVSACLVTAAAVGLWTMRAGRLDETYAAWFLGAITIDLLVLVVLGALRAAWATMGVVALLAGWWAAAHAMPLIAGGGLVVRHVATLLVGTLIVTSVRRSRVAYASFQALRRRRSTEEEAAAARRAARRIAVEQVLDQAGPTLRAIAEGQRFTAEDRRQIVVLEGALRDQIRTPLLVRGQLRDSVDAARRRGVNVLLMDETDAGQAAPRSDAAAWLAVRLDETDAGGFVGRVRTAGTGVRVSAVTDTRGDARSFPGR